MRTPLILMILTGCAQGSVSATVDASAMSVDSLVIADAPPSEVVFPSCVGLAATCGPMGNQDCCESSGVEGGTFYRSYDFVDNLDASFPATVSGFRFDNYEITVARFRAFVDAGQGTQLSPPPIGAGAHPAITGSGWTSVWNTNLSISTAALRSAVQCNALATWTTAPGANEHFPMMCLTWFEANAFCAWDGGRLPTEAEWNYAASGGSEQRAYPWSMPATSVAIDLTKASYSCTGDTQAGCALPDLFQVGVLPAGKGRWGQSDLSGNAWEWTLDGYGTYAMPCVDCAQLTGPQRVLRGGGYQSSTTGLRAANRNKEVPTARFNDVGVRCVRPISSVP